MRASLVRLFVVGIYGGDIMTGTHVCLFCGTEFHIKHKAGRIPEYCSTHCRNARKYLNAYLRKLRHVDLERCGSEVRSELFMIANTVVKAATAAAKNAAALVSPSTVAPTGVSSCLIPSAPARTCPRSPTSAPHRRRHGCDNNAAKFLCSPHCPSWT